MYVCPTCGDGLEFNPKTQKLLCPSCRNEYDPEKIEKMRLDQAKEVTIKENEYEVVSYKCSHCGAELVTTDETITTFCSFCRNGTMLNRRIVKKRKPDYIIPFKITKKECEEIYINKIKNALFAPKSMIETQEVEKIRGIYMPYWIYSFEEHGENIAIGSKYAHRSGDYVYYNDFSLATNVDATFCGVTHDATSNFTDRLSEAIEPFNADDRKKFSPAYLSGYYADNEDVGEKTYMEESENIASKYISKQLGKDKEYHKYNAKPSVSFDNKKAELALFPVYFLATKNKKGDRMSYAVINGQTGKIAADIPIDLKKFLKCSIFFALIIFIVLNLFISFSMPKLIVSSIIFNIINILILRRQSEKIKIRQTNADDKGAQSKVAKIKLKNTENENNKDTYKKTIAICLLIIIVVPIIGILLYQNFGILKYMVLSVAIIVFILGLIIKIRKPETDTGIYKNILGLLITLTTFCFRPAEDLYYYLTAIFSILMTILSFINIVNKFNILTTRKLPQLEKRGGDENA